MVRERWFRLLLVIVIANIVFHGCGKKPPEDTRPQVTVAFWGSPEEKDIITSSLDEWQQANPGIKIRFEHAPADGYVQKMLTRIAGGAAPDILCIRVDHFINFASKNVLLNLTPYIENDETFDIKKYFHEVVESFSANGNVYALPRDTAPYACVFYNKDVFDQKGVAYPTDDWTWDEMLEKAQALTGEDERGRMHYGYYGWAWENFVYGNGGNLVDDVKHPTQCMLDTDDAIEGLQFYADLINKYNVMPTPIALANTGMGVDMMFADGNIAMFQSGIWETPALLTYDYLNWDVVMFPKSSKGIRRFGTGGSAYGILASCKHPDLAWEVLKGLSGPVGQTELARRGLAQPAIREIAEGEAWARNDLPPTNKAMLNEAVKYVVYDPFHVKWIEARAKYIIPELELLFNGKQDARTAVSKFIDNVNNMLQEDK
ncbi:MAG: sugar ABC transporter substrate-binding protein [Candidatus Omnitrophica bacterium]|nr:sugar ABC transporter substrate-binding protein [Candidatus Omnitrophota bacterium]